MEKGVGAGPRRPSSNLPAAPDKQEQANTIIWALLFESAKKKPATDLAVRAVELHPPFTHKAVPYLIYTGKVTYLLVLNDSGAQRGYLCRKLFCRLIIEHDECSWFSCTIRYK